jgi:hypothetical protein
MQLGKASSESMKTISIIEFTLLIIGQFLGKKVLKKIWFHFCILQIIIYINFPAVTFPLNAHNCIETSREIIEFDAFPKEKATIWAKNKTSSILSNENLGYKIVTLLAILATVGSCICLCMVAFKFEPVSTKKFLTKIK